MLSICTCLIKGCSSRRKQQSCFPKKPLVAISLIVVVTMCLTLAEAAPRHAEHRTRHHRRQANLMDPQTKDFKRQDYQLYKNCTSEILNRIKNAQMYYKNELRQYTARTKSKRRNGNPKWLPKIKFVDLHRNLTDASRFPSVEDRLKHVLPKLYRHIMEYQELFAKLENVTILTEGDIFVQRQDRITMLNNTIIRLGLFITTVTDVMDRIHMPYPYFDPSQMNLEAFGTTVDSSASDLQDQIVFRGYENLLYYWKSEFSCGINKKKRPMNKKMCRMYEERLKMRDARVGKSDRKPARPKRHRATRIRQLEQH